MKRCRLRGDCSRVGPVRVSPPPPDDGTNPPRRVVVALPDGPSRFRAVEEEETVKRWRRQQEPRINKGALLGATAAKERG